MFEIGWTELLIIAIVAIVVIGPKDLPRVMRLVGQWTGKLKRMSRTFQNQFNEALREAELDGVRKDVEALGKSMREDVAKAGEDIKKASADIDKGMQVSAPPTVETPALPAPGAVTAPSPVQAEAPAAAEPVAAEASTPRPVEAVPVSPAEPAAAAAAGEAKP